MMDFSNESEEIIESGESETSENENESEEEDDEEVITEILGNLQPYQYEPGNDNECSESFAGISFFIYHKIPSP